MFAKIKKKWKKILHSIAEQNKATYGEGPINCCELQGVIQTKNEHTK